MITVALATAMRRSELMNCTWADVDFDAQTIEDARLKVVNNFKRSFDKILLKAGVKKGTFHDIRRTAISMWFVNGMSEYEVMRLAGHSDFATTHKFYLTVADGLVDGARVAVAKGLRQIMVQSGAEAF